MVKRAIVWLALVAALLFAFASRVAAQTAPVDTPPPPPAAAHPPEPGDNELGGETTAILRAGTITYDKTRVVAQGNVVFIYEEMTMKTEKLTYNPETGDVQSDGPVDFHRPGEDMHGLAMTYNVKTGNGLLMTAKGKTNNIYVQGQPIKGFLFFSGQSLEMKNGAYVFIHTTATTCDFPEGKQHYHITAERIDVYPGDKMIISHGRLWLGNLPLYRVAKLVIDLRPHIRHRHSYIPSLGYDQVDGFFIKTAFDYMATEDSDGELLVDYYQKTGLAAGIRQEFPIGTRGSGELDLYQQNGTGLQHFTREQDSFNFRYNFGKGLSATGNINLFRFNVPPVVSPDNITEYFALNKQYKGGTWSLTENGDSTTGYVNSQTVQYHINQNVGGGVDLDLTENYLRDIEGGVTDSTLHNLTNLMKQFNGWTLNLYYEKTDSSLFSGGFVNRLPQLALKSDTFEFMPLKLPYQINMTVSDYYESLEKINAIAYDFQLNVPQHVYNLSNNLKLTESGLYQQDFYDTGDYYPTQQYSARYLLGDDTQISTALANHFDALIDYRSQSNIGFDPLVFDTFPPFRTLSAEFAFHAGDIFRIDIGSAYDYKNRFYQQLVTRIDFRPKKKWEFHIDAFYDPNLHQWDDAILQADLWPIKETELNGVRLQYWADYNVPTGKLGYEDIALTKEWHDWEARLIYEWQQQQIFLLFNLKAFPEQQVQLGINPVYYVPGASQYFLP